MTERSRLSFFYREPAEAWYDAFPLGNGAIGAMHFGGIAEDCIQISEGTFWSGEPSEENVADGAHEVVEEIRKQLVAEEFVNARNAAEAIIGRKENYGTNLPFGRLCIASTVASDAVAEYRRTLSLTDAVSHVAYTHAGETYSREVFVSHVDQVLVVRLTCSGSAKIAVSVKLESDGDSQDGAVADGQTIRLVRSAHESIHSDGKTGVCGESLLFVETEGGSVAANKSDLVVEGADEVRIYCAVATDFGNSDPKNLCDSRIQSARNRGYGSLKARHIEDHMALFCRVTLELPSSIENDAPIDRRIQDVCNGKEDPGLYALLFQFGRYLLIGSSRADSLLPAHLTGVWNDSVACRIGWTCDYHLDINTQMNYWIAETTNLSECHTPLFRWLTDTLVPSGRGTARKLYGSSGWVAHIVSNAWGFSAPGWSTHWGFFPTGGVWVASHLWNQYQFTQNEDFLAQTAYPVLKESAAFFLDYLFEHPEKKWLMSGPSCDPETAFVWNGERCPLSLSPTVDRILLYELFSYCIAASQTLGIDSDFAEKCSQARGKLPPYQIDKNGGIQEWLDDVENALPHHRHTSHLLGLFPYDQITPIDTPDLASAARTALEKRLNAPGGFEEGSWARNNITLFYARLHDCENAYASLSTLVKKGADRSLMAGTKNAPQNAYEMDYNTGATAGITEMLMQSHCGRIHLLPALPSEWHKGKVAGLCARGGFEVDISWNEGSLLQAKIISKAGLSCTILADKPVVVSSNGEDVQFTKDQDNSITWQTVPGGEYLVTAV